MGFISLTLGYHLGLYLTPNPESIFLIRQQCNIPLGNHQFNNIPLVWDGASNQISFIVHSTFLATFWADHFAPLCPFWSFFSDLTPSNNWIGWPKKHVSSTGISFIRDNLLDEIVCWVQCQGSAINLLALSNDLWMHWLSNAIFDKANGFLGSTSTAQLK